MSLSKECNSRSNYIPTRYLHAFSTLEKLGISGLIQGKENSENPNYSVSLIHCICHLLSNVYTVSEF